MILAGGLGTRMRPLTETCPKALLPVSGQPFVHHQLEWLARHSVTDVVLSIGYLGEMIRSFVGDGRAWGLDVRYVDEGPRLRGTGGALRLALDQGVLKDSFLVTYGDSFLPIDFGNVYGALLRCGKPALMTVFRNEGAYDTSNVIFDRAAGIVELYDKRRTSRPAGDFAFIDYGLSAMHSSVIRDGVPAQQTCDLADVYKVLSLRGDLAGYEVQERFYEIGSSDGLVALEERLKARGNT